MTTRYTNVCGVPYPDGNSGTNIPSHFQQVAQGFDTLCIPRFPTTASRDAAIPSPQEGMFCYVSQAGVRQLQGYNGSAWKTVFPTTLVAEKTSNTQRTTTDASNDPHLVVPVEANSYYTFIASLRATGINSDNGDGKFAFGIPGNSTVYLGVLTASDASGGNVSDRLLMAGGYSYAGASPIGVNLTSNPLNILFQGGLHVGPAAGTLAVMWAVNNAGQGTTMQLDMGSYLVVNKVVSW